MLASDLVNLDSYPIDNLDCDQGRALVERCRDDLTDHALCQLPGFIRPDRLPEMIREMRGLEDVRRRVENAFTVYPWMDNSGFPEGHPRSTLFRRRFDYLIADQVPEASLIRRLFEWDPLTEFVRRALGFETLYRSACPTEAIQCNYMFEGDMLSWHFDTNDGVVSLLLDTAEEGGHFQVAPFVRDEDDERYDQVARALDGDPEVVLQPEMKPGTFVLFRGRRSVHRVSPVSKTSRPRMVVLYSYDRRPNMVFTQESQDYLRYPTAEPFLGALTPKHAEGFTVRE